MKVVAEEARKGRRRREGRKDVSAGGIGNKGVHRKGSGRLWEKYAETLQSSST